MIKIDSDIEGGFSNVWVTSDTHYGHKNICRGVTDWRLPDGRVPVDNTRNFQTIEQMNDAIVNNINNVVSQNDVLIHLGDWSFGGFENIKKFYDRLVCKNIHLILGNHDENIEKNKDSTQELFLTVSHYETLVIGKRKLRLMHYPISSWDGLSKGVIHLHGHLHSPTQNRMGVGRKFDVGIDGHPDFRPYHLTKELIPMLEKRPIESEVKFDHHLDGMKNVVG